MTHIVITAGGTSEPIDGVRKISNTSTGGLCACIYEALSDRIGAQAAERGKAGGSPAFRVHYVAAATAVRPEERENLPVSFYPVTDVGSVCSVLEALMKRYEIGCVIHGMAVSDFKKEYLIRRDTLAEELARAVVEAVDDARGKPDADALEKIVRGSWRIRSTRWSPAPKSARRRILSSRWSRRRR
jgi:phosphopantothenate-cysteine ligase